MSMSDELYKEMIRKYMNGSCMYLAAALHHTYGLPLGMSVVYRWAPKLRGGFCNEGTVYHVWNVLPNGNCLDITGEQSFSDMIEEVKSLVLQDDIYLRIYKKATFDEVVKICGRGSLTMDMADVLDAYGVAKEFLSKYLNF